MSLWVDLYGFDETDRYGDLHISGNAKALIEKGITPIAHWSISDEMFVRFNTRHDLRYAIQHVSMYIVKEFSCVPCLENSDDFEFNGMFTVSFTDNK